MGMSMLRMVPTIFQNNIALSPLRMCIASNIFREKTSAMPGGTSIMLLCAIRHCNKPPHPQRLNRLDIIDPPIFRKQKTHWFRKIYFRNETCEAWFFFRHWTSGKNMPGKIQQHSRATEQWKDLQFSQGGRVRKGLSKIKNPMTRS